MKWVYVGGTFDLFHAGHVSFLQRCAEYGPVLVALNDDDFAARFKRRPIIPYKDRLAVLLACRWVRHIVRNCGAEDSKMTILYQIDSGLTIRWVAHGTDWPLYQTIDGKEHGLYQQMGLTPEWLAGYGIEMLMIDRPEDSLSASGIIKAIRNHEMCAKGH